MHRLSAFALSLAACGLLLSPSFVFAQELDTIYPIPNGAPIRGTVTDMTSSTVTMDRREIPITGIRRLNFATDPAELRTARDNIATGRYEDAKEDLAKINLASVTQNVVKADIAYYIACADAHLALQGNGDKEAAHQLLTSFLSGNSGNYHYYEGAQLVGDLAIARGKFADAKNYYAVVEKAPFPEYQLRAQVLQAKALIPLGKYDEARDMYEKVIANSLSTPEVNREKEFAKIGRVVCLANTGKEAEAEQIVNDIIRNNDAKDTALFGRAYNALGAAHMKSGKLKQALEDYLHTDLLFYTDAEAHAEALYYLSKLWNDARKNSDEALRAKELLKRRYAGTLWAQLP